MCQSIVRERVPIVVCAVAFFGVTREEQSVINSLTHSQNENERDELVWGSLFFFLATLFYLIFNILLLRSIADYSPLYKFTL